MTYKFFGADTPAVTPTNSEYANVRDQRHLYDLLSKAWCIETCAPRLREGWSESNRTLGQCSITAFLVQDIFGGEVYGIPLPSGGYHCYNAVGGVTFDLTSEQFGEQKLTFDLSNPQEREEHFKDEEKKARYLLLKSKLRALLP